MSNSGEVEIRPTKIALEVNLKFTFKLLGRATFTSWQLDLSGSEWQSFKRAIKIRDRITHPKQLSQLNISDDDFDDVSTAITWVIVCYLKLFSTVKAPPDWIEPIAE